MPKALISDINGTLIDSDDLHAAAWVEPFPGISGLRWPLLTPGQIVKVADQLMPVFIEPHLLQERGERGGDVPLGAVQARLPAPRPSLSRRAPADRAHQGGWSDCGAASSGKQEEVDHHVRAAEIGDFIDGVTTVDDAERSKPDPDIFAAALQLIAPLGPGGGRGRRLAV